MTIRIAIVHDSASVRAALRVALEIDEDLVVVGEAGDGDGALPLVIESRADILLMDVVMPRLDGYAATRRVMAEHPLPILLVSSVVNPRDVKVALDAMRSGALAIVETIPSPLDPTYRFRRGALAHLVRSLASVRLEPKKLSFDDIPTPRPDAGARGRRVIGIAASTGGPGVVASLLRALRHDDLPPVLVVQHIAAGFADGFARWLGDTIERPTALAEDGVLAQRGRVYVARDDRHLELAPDGRLRVRRGEPVHRFRPSATPLFHSLAAFGPQALGIVLTGMGADGADGAAALREAKGKLLVQDEATSVVYGMPRAALERAGADAVMPPAAMPPWIGHWLREDEA
ncbi:MAG: chemotaxis protein CheB [Sandaracinus sp.]